jgi:hypothetical protein
MLSSVSEKPLPWISLAAAAGTGAYAFPLIVPWHIFILAACGVAGIGLCRTRTRRLIWSVLFTVVFIAVLTGYVSSTLAAAVVSASVLAMSSTVAIAAAILLMHISTIATIQEFVADRISWLGLESAGPSLIAISILLLARFHFSGRAFVAGVLSVLVAWAADLINLSPEMTMALVALPVCGLSVLMVRDERPIGRITPSVTIIVALVVGLLSWVWTMPRSWNEVYYLMPEAPEAFEAKYFSNYLEALAFAGVKAKQAKKLEDVSPGSLLLLPRLTSPFTTATGDPFTKRLGELARKRRWTVVIGGEHTNLGEVADRVEAITGQPMLRRDLTVPTGNTDNSGPLHISDLRAWPHEAILNRGASVRVSSLADKVLLAGDGWWAEPDIGEWLWVGNYVSESVDRAGRLTLAVSSDKEGARWVVIGDNSPLFNNQIISDPRPTIRLLQSATLWPAFLRDVFIATLVLVICIPFSGQYWSSWLPFFIVGSVTALGVYGSMMSNEASQAWRDSYIGESGFNERNFNVTLAKNPELVKGRRLIRLKAPVSGEVHLPEGDSTIFMVVGGIATVGGVKLSHCRRMGALSTTDGPYLMDAQACRMSGPARALIGTPKSAAAISIRHAKGETLIILDVAFLAQNAPAANGKWLLEQVKRE